MTSTCFYWEKKIPVNKRVSESVPFEFANDLGVSFHLSYECRLITDGSCMIYAILIDWNLGAFQFKNLSCSIENEPEEYVPSNCILFEREAEISQEFVDGSAYFKPGLPLS